MNTKTNVWTVDKLSFHAKGMYELLHHYANPYTGECWPGVETLSRQAGLSRPTIRKAINELSQRQLIEVRRKNGFSTHYILMLSTTGKADCSPPGNVTSRKERPSPAGNIDVITTQKGNVFISGQRSFQPCSGQTRAMESLGLVMRENETGEVELYDAE